MFWLILALSLIVLYFTGRYISPFGEMLSFLFVFIGKPLLRLENLLEAFKEKLVSSDSEYIGLHTVTCLVALFFAVIVLTAETFNSFDALTSLYGGNISTPSMPPVLNLAMGALFLACPALLGMCWLEVKEVVPEEARIFTLLQEKSRGWFNNLVTIGLWLSIPDVILYYALRPLFLANPDSGLVVLLQFIIFVILGAVLPLVSILSLYILAIGIQTFFALLLALSWFLVSALTDVFDFLSRFFRNKEHPLDGLRPVVVSPPPVPVVAAPAPTLVIQAAPTIAALPGFSGTPLEEVVLDAIPVALKNVPYPGRSREHMPLEGTDTFKELINKILDEMAEKAPDYLEQCLENLPKIQQDMSIYPPAIGNSSGLFAYDGNIPYDVARLVLAHEVGHNVYMLQHDDIREDSANDYAAKMVAKIARYEVDHVSQ